MIDLILDIFTYQAPNVNQAFIPALMAVGGAVQALSAIDWTGKRAEEMRNSKAAYQKQLNVYKGLDTSNAYANVKNRYAGMESKFAGMDNAMSDLQVNTQQAEFMGDQFQQSQANIMSNMQGAAGGSGVASLAQAMANSSAKFARQSSASIGAQEAKNNMMATQNQAKINMMTAQEQSKNQMMMAKGAQDVDMAQAKGQLMSMQMEQSKQGTILGMDANRVAAANQAQMMAQQQIIGGIGNIASAGIMKYNE
mgnify:CR=1 FL=1|tara:strand:+ start:180 stop:935 length:756 start_codon:yes stop_codon:yes gene_type:complete